jgi:hypothetical protein
VQAERFDRRRQQRRLAVVSTGPAAFVEALGREGVVSDFAAGPGVTAQDGICLTGRLVPFAAPIPATRRVE